MKDKKWLCIAVCLIAVLISCMFLNKDSYNIQDIDKVIESIFISNYDSLFKASDILFDENTNILWENITDDLNEDIIIEKIHYIGKQSQADLMVMTVCGMFDEEMISFLDDNFSNEQYCTSSYYSFFFDLNSNSKMDTSNFNRDNATPFSLRLANDVVNNNFKMIVSYKVLIDNEWHRANSIINVEDPTYIFLPNEIYGKGKME